MGKWNPINIAKEFAKGTTVTGFHSEEFGSVSGASKKKLKGVGSYDSEGTFNKKGKEVKGKKRR